MKKGIKIAAAAALAASALTPVAALAAETTLATGYYSDTFTSLTDFAKKTPSEKKAFFLANYTKENFVFVDATGKVYDFKSANGEKALNAKTEAAAASYATTAAAYQTATGVTISASGITKTPVAPVGELKVESVSAINKTTLTVALGTAVDAVTASNFTIAGANVTAATLAADKKTVTLTVSGLAYSTDYTLEAKNIQVAGSAKDFTSKAFKTVGVNDLWELKITAKNVALIADGADNTEVTFQLINKVTGAVDTNADNVVLDLNTTFGTLAQKRVTIQNGTATLLLTSEFQNAAVTAKIDAQIIEASGDYKDLIGQVFGTLNVPFNPTNVDNVQSITAVAAEANQADRFTVFFDKDVVLTHFVKHTNGVLAYNYFNTTTNLTSEVLATNLTDAQKADQINLTHALANALDIKQGTKTTFKVKGFKTVANNPKAIEVILDKSTPLTDNEQVNVGLNTTNSLGKVTKSEVSFKVTDARVPSATSVAVEGLNTLKVKFSEAIKETTLGINGQFKGEPADTASAASTRVTAINTLAATGNKTNSFVYYFGDFNPFTQVDNRDLATVLLTKNYIEDGTGKVAGFFSAASHSIQIASSKDFAALSDTNNVGTTQNLSFTVAADTGIPTASVVVESPEQFRLKFDKTVASSEATISNLITSGKIKLQVKNTSGTFVDATTLTAGQGQVTLADLLITDVKNNEYVIELKRDWTVIHDTAATNKNYYNYEYQLVVAKDAFTNNGNGKKNEEQKLSLNYTGSPLNTPDTLSPVISNVVRQGATNTLHVTMSEPVKLKSGNIIRDDADETRAQTQTVLENTTVQFMGKDKDGKIVTIDGVVGDYLTTIRGADNQFAISWATTTGAVTPQSVTDAGGSTEWEVVVRVITDDVGNAAASVKYPVTIAKTTGTSAFIIDKYAAGGANAGKYRVEGYSTADATVTGTAGVDLRDKVEIVFSEGVQWTGTHDATNPAQYTLNGKTLPVGTVIEVFDVGGTTAYAASASATATGIEGVRITLPDGTLNIGAGFSNVITVNKNLTSYDGTVITGETEIVVNVAENIALTNLNNTIIAADAAQKAAATSVAAVIPTTKTALAGAYTTYETAVTAYGTAVTTAKTALATATHATADGIKTTLDGATTTFNAAKTAYETAVTALATARTGLTTAKTAADTAQKAAAAVVAAVSASDKTALAGAYTTYGTAVTAYGTAVTAANTVLTNDASTTAQLDAAVATLATATTTTFNAAKTAYETAVTALATARTTFTSEISTATTNSATGIVTATGTGAGTVTATEKAAYDAAIATATLANTATATAADLDTAKALLVTATGTYNTAKAS